MVYYAWLQPWIKVIYFIFLWHVTDKAWSWILSSHIKPDTKISSMKNAERCRCSYLILKDNNFVSRLAAKYMRLPALCLRMEHLTNCDNDQRKDTAAFSSNQYISFQKDTGIYLFYQARLWWWHNTKWLFCYNTDLL